MFGINEALEIKLDAIALNRRGRGSFTAKCLVAAGIKAAQACCLSGIDGSLLWLCKNGKNMPST